LYPPPPVPPRAGTPTAFVVLIAGATALVFGLGGCAVGFALGASSDDVSGTAARTLPAQRPSGTPGSSRATPAGKPRPRTVTIGDGTHRVPEDVRPGTYRTDGGDGCCWARLRSLHGGLRAIIANEIADGSAVVTIKASDAGFQSKRCGSWARVGK